MGQVLVLDFDGTMTDAELEGAPFREGYLDDLAILTGLDIDEVQALAAGYEDEIRARSQEYGWLFGGRIVAPAIVDPYLRMMPVARKLFDHSGAFSDPDDRRRLLDGILYKYNYGKTATAFRPGAGEVLRSLAGTATYVVTNSHTVPVQDKIRRLGAEEDGSNALQWLVERVHGRARKYVIDDDFEAVPETLGIPGLSRPVLLRRRMYHDVLRGLLDANGADWSDLLVVGDIFELDLALPLAMGAQVGLVTNPFTPDYEKAFVEGHARGRLVAHLDAIPGLLQR